MAHALWNNQGDCGYLYDPNGLIVSSACYGAAPLPVSKPILPTSTPPVDYPLPTLDIASAIPVQPPLVDDWPAVPVQPVLANDLPAIAAGPLFPTPAQPAEVTIQGQHYGAICRDGRHSTATGSGACSHHHGVEHTLVYP